MSLVGGRSRSLPAVAATIKPCTIHLAGAAFTPPLPNCTSAVYTSDNTLSFPLQFSGRDLTNNDNWISIAYGAPQASHSALLSPLRACSQSRVVVLPGPPISPTLFTCDLMTAQSSTTDLVCNTQSAGAFPNPLKYASGPELRVLCCCAALQPSALCSSSRSTPAAGSLRQPTPSRTRCVPRLKAKRWLSNQRSMRGFLAPLVCHGLQNDLPEIYGVSSDSCVNKGNTTANCPTAGRVRPRLRHCSLQLLARSISFASLPSLSSLSLCGVSRSGSR